eukprot:3980869-Prymnesium_polylepis.1
MLRTARRGIAWWDVGAGLQRSFVSVVRVGYRGGVWWQRWRGDPGRARCISFAVWYLKLLLLLLLKLV